MAAPELRAPQGCVQKGFTAGVAWLLGTGEGHCLLFLAVGALLLLFGAASWSTTNGNKHYEHNLNDSLWVSWSVFIDTGTQMAKFSAHDPGRERWVAVFFSVSGLVFNLTLLGTVVDLVHRRLSDYKELYSRIDAHGHVLILGWGEKTLWLLNELLSAEKYANAEEKHRCGGCCRRRGRRIVILADRDAVVMRQDVRMHLAFEGLSASRVAYRRGNVMERTDLMKVSAAAAQDILIVGTGGDERRSDEEIVQTLLALGALPDVSRLAGGVFAEMQTHDNARIVSTILPDAKGIMPRYSTHRMLVLRAVVPSVGFAYLDMVSFRKGEELYVVPVHGGLLGMPFSRACQVFPEAVVCAVLPALPTDYLGKPVLCMDGARTLQHGDHLLLLAASWEAAKSWHQEAMDATGLPAALGEQSHAAPTFFQSTLGRLKPMLQPDGQLDLGPQAVGPKVVVVIGCPEDYPNILQALDEYLARGSEVHVLSTRSLSSRQGILQSYFELSGSALLGDQAAQMCCERFRRIDVKHHVGIPTSTDDISLLPLEAADIALVLAEQADQEAPAAVDSRNLTAAILLRGLLSECPRAGKKCKVVTELLDPKSQQVLLRNNSVRSCGSFVYSDSIAIGVFARAVADKLAYNVLLGLLDPQNHDGHITAIPARNFVHGVESLSYRELQGRVWDSYGGILLGWRRSNERYPVLNPKLKSKRVDWNACDKDELITLRPHIVNGDVLAPPSV